jgi:hypothetical protein
MLRQQGDVLAEEVRGNQGVAVDADDNLAARPGDGKVEAGGHNAAGVVDDNQPGLERLQAGENLPRAIGGKAVRDDHLHPILRVILRQDRADQLGDELCFVANRNDDAYEWSGVSRGGGHVVDASRVLDMRVHRLRTVFTTESISSARIAENSGRLTRRFHSADATGRSWASQPKVSS